MLNILKIYVLLLIFVFVPVGTAYSQLTSSPYSIFGLGTRDGNSAGTSSAMGGTGIAFLSGTSLNTVNPASYGGLDSLKTLFDIGLFAKYTSYRTKSGSQSLFDANLRYFTMSFKPAPGVGTSFGIVPYSSVGYKINTISIIDGSTSEYSKTFEGEGGVDKVYLGNSFKLSNNLFLGVNASFLFGSITRTEASSDGLYSYKDKNTFYNFYLDYGLNYKIKGNKLDYRIGIIYGDGKTLRTNSESYITTTSSYEVLKGKKKIFRIPRNFGAGLAVNNRYFRAGIDYEREYWSEINFNRSLMQTRNSNRYSLGLEFASLGSTRSSGNIIYYRFGAEFTESYLIINKDPINYRSISFGTGLPVKGMVNVFNISLEIGQNGTKNNGLIKENFYKLNIDVSLKDLWFIKRLYQ
jgi:hypothetical protein